MSLVTADGEPVTSASEQVMWQRVSDWCDHADAVFFDGCHKIYLSMDREQSQLFDSYGYEFQFRGPSDDMFSMVEGWYWDSGCPLRFVQAVATVDGDPNDGFVSLVPQFFTQNGEGE